MPSPSQRAPSRASTSGHVAPTSPADPQGTVEFYAVIFLSIGATMGAAVFGLMMGSVRRLSTLALRTLSLAAYSALLAGGVTLYVDAVLGALRGHTWQVFGALWLYAMGVAGAVTGVAAAFGTVASALVTESLLLPMLVAPSLRRVVRHLLSGTPAGAGATLAGQAAPWQ